MKNLILFLLCTTVLQAQINLNEFLILDLPFNGNAIDESGNLNLPIQIYGATLCNDRNESPNSAYYFDGIDDYISVPHQEALNLTNSYSVSFWVKLSSDIIGEQERIIGKGLAHTGNVQNWSFTFKDNQTIDYFWEPENDINMLNSSIDILDSQKFYHIVGVIDTELEETKLYINGVVNITNSTNSYTPTINNYDLLLGVRENYQLGGNFDNFYDGIIDDVKIYEKALNDCEVIALYNEATLNFPSILDLQITQTENILSANLFASTYTWYLNDSVLEGLNTQEIEILEEGTYQVQIESQGCISEFTEIYILNTKELNNSKVRIYPNPSSKFIVVDSTYDTEIQSLSLISLSGKTLQVTNSNKMAFYSRIQKGFYLLRIELTNKRLVYKQIIIE